MSLQFSPPPACHQPARQWLTLHVPEHQREASASCCREIAEVAGISEKDVLYISPSNEALAHLPYMIALDR